MVALSTPLNGPDGIYIPNVSMSTPESVESVERRLPVKRLGLKERLTHDIERLNGESLYLG